MSGSSSPDQANFAAELIKLLLQVAWADHDIAAAEAQKLLEYARRQRLSDTELAEVSAMLRGGVPLAPPNMGLLKQRRPEVLRAVRELLLSDLEVNADETALLEQISALLR